MKTVFLLLICYNLIWKLHQSLIQLHDVHEEKMRPPFIRNERKKGTSCIDRQEFLSFVYLK